MRALLALLSCAPTKRPLRTRARARSRPKAQRKRSPSRPRERPDGAIAVKQAAAVDEDAQRIAKEAAAAVARQSRLDWRTMKGGGATRAAPTSRARCRSTPSTVTARWPSSTPATLSSCGSEAARSSAGRTSQRRRLSTSRRSRGCLRATALPARHRRLAPMAAARPSTTEGGQPHAARKGARTLYCGRLLRKWREGLHLRLFL